jgi:hypothetical protein
MDYWKKRYEPAPFSLADRSNCRVAPGGSLLVDICKQDRRRWLHDPRGNCHCKNYFYFGFEYFDC